MVKKGCTDQTNSKRCCEFLCVGCIVGLAHDNHRMTNIDDVSLQPGFSCTCQWSSTDGYGKSIRNEQKVCVWLFQFTVRNKCISTLWLVVLCQHPERNRWTTKLDSAFTFHNHFVIILNGFFYLWYSCWYLAWCQRAFSDGNENNSPPFFKHSTSLLAIFSSKIPAFYA